MFLIAGLFLLLIYSNYPNFIQNIAFYVFRKYCAIEQYFVMRFSKTSTVSYVYDSMIKYDENIIKVYDSMITKNDKDIFIKVCTYINKYDKQDILYKIGDKCDKVVRKKSPFLLATLEIDEGEDEINLLDNLDKYLLVGNTLFDKTFLKYYLMEEYDYYLSDDDISNLKILTTDLKNVNINEGITI